MTELKIIELILAENKTDKRLKVWLFKEDKKLMLGILKKDFKIVSTREVKK